MASQPTAGSVRAFCLAGAHLETKVGPAADDMNTTRPPFGSSSGTIASTTRLLPRTLTLSIVPIGPSATPALFTTAYSLEEPSLDPIKAAAACTDASSSTSSGTTVTRPFGSVAAAASPLTASREPRKTVVSAWALRISEQIARPMPLLPPVTSTAR
jgi:hypothetical protein